MGPKWLLNELASAIWPLIDANIIDQLAKLYLFDSVIRMMCGGDMSPYSVSGYYRGLRERWMRESHCYFFCHMPKKWGYSTLLSKKWGVRVPLVTPVSYAYARDCPNFLSTPIISGTGKATNFKLGGYIHSVHANKSALKIWENRDSPTF